VLGGVFVRHAETKELVFQEGRAPSREEIAVIAARVEKRMTRWLRRRDLVDERAAEDRSNEAPSPDPLEACMQMSLLGGTFLRLDKDGTPVPLDDEPSAIVALLEHLGLPTEAPPVARARSPSFEPA